VRACVRACVCVCVRGGGIPLTQLSRTRVRKQLKASLVRMLCGYRALTGPAAAHLLDAPEMGAAYACLPARGCCLLSGGALAASLSPGPWLSLATLCLARVVALADGDVAAIVGACPALTDLDVSGCFQLSGKVR
jgi:hypothetical protein